MVPSDVSESVFGLFQPEGGLFASTFRHQSLGPEPRFTTRMVEVGDISQLGLQWGRTRKTAGRHTARGIVGSGVGVEDDEAFFLALTEALERYCTCIFDRERFTVASAAELGDEALDLDTIPRCSATELSHPLCPLVAPAKDQPIRWVRALSLLDGRLVYVPVVMAYLWAGFHSRAERLCTPLTTGCAAHVSYEQALVNAILEVIERDAISVIWLQQLALPKIVVDSVPPTLAASWDRYQHSSRDTEYIFFDAASDLGVPTVYGIQRSPFNPELHILVSCSSALNAATAVAKTIRDMSSIRVAFRTPPRVPDNFDEFTDILHGAAYMAHQQRAPAFDFLLSSTTTTKLSEMDNPDDGRAPAEALRYLLERLRRRRMDAYAVDLTTDESLRCGIRVVRVIIPGLQPLSFSYRARYLGHPRLYEAPARMGYRVLSEDQVNPWPQPFA